MNKAIRKSLEIFEAYDMFMMFFILVKGVMSDVDGRVIRCLRMAIVAFKWLDKATVHDLLNHMRRKVFFQ